jgi:hypothetical protein
MWEASSDPSPKRSISKGASQVSTDRPEEGLQGSGDATPGFEGKRTGQRAERHVANRRRQPGTNEEPSFETGDKVKNPRRAHEPRKRSVQATRRQDPEGRALDPRHRRGTERASP